MNLLVEEEYLLSLIERRQSGMARGPGIKIRPSDLTKVRQTLEIFEQWGGWLRFYEEEGADIDLVEVVDRFPYLQRIDVDGAMKNLFALEQCEHLETLSIHGKTKSEALDISKIKQLLSFGFDDDIAGINIASASLNELKACGKHFAGSDLRTLSNCPAIENLTLINVQCETLNGIESLRQLKRLVLNGCKHITSLTSLGTVSESLIALHLENITKNLELDVIGKLQNLEQLSLVGIGDIESLRCISAHQKLQNIILSRVNILDGRLSLLKNLTSLRNADYIDKPHYDLRVRELEEFLNGQRKDDSILPMMAEDRCLEHPAKASPELELKTSERSVSETENLADYFRGLQEDGLSQYSSEVISSICDVINDYSNRVKDLGNNATNEQLFSKVAQVIQHLNKLHSEHRNELFETEERELLVSIINAVVESAGLNLENFEGSDPTFQLREF